ncbi:MAG: HAD family hydrolase [Woeseiaceae bacterium]
MTVIEAISFDLDDTFWPVAPLIRGAETAMREWIRTNYPTVFETVSEDDIRQYRREVVAENRDRLHDLTFLRKAVLSRMAQASRVEKAMVDGSFEAFDQARNRVDLFPGVLDLLDALSDRFPLIACSNGNASLEKTGIAQFFTAHISAKSAGAAKPDPAIFRAVTEAAKCPARRILHVGDDIKADVDGARRAGMQTVWVNATGSVWPIELGEPPVTVRQVIELQTTDIPGI